MSIDSKGFFTRTPLLALVGSALMLAGCSPRIYVEQDQNASFGGYHSFAWVSPPAGPVQDPILDSQILESRVHDSVTADLKTRGYKEVQGDGAPDFLVTYHTSSKQKIESDGSSLSFGIMDTFPRGFGAVGFPVGGNVETRDVGTLMLDVIDGKSKRLVWRGWTNGNLDQDNYSDTAVATAVQRIFDKLPNH